MKKVIIVLFLFTFSNLFSQNVIVNPGGNSYPTLKAAFDAINLGIIWRNIDVSIQIVGNTTETTIAKLHDSARSVTITPIGTRVITGNLASELILLHGADHVTINGLNTGGNSLTISNTSSSSSDGTSTIKFYNSADSNIITNCNILGSSTINNYGSIDMKGGTIFFYAELNVSDGNDANVISNCNVGPAGTNLPSVAIGFQGGTFSQDSNFNDTIRSCNIYDYFLPTGDSYGIAAFNGNTIVVSNNKFFQTSPREFTSNANVYKHISVYVPGGSNPVRNRISSNIIGYSSSSQTGFYEISGFSHLFRAIEVYNGLFDTMYVSNNLIDGIKHSSANTNQPLKLISANLDNVKVFNNTVGSMSDTSRIIFTSTNTQISSRPDVIGIESILPNGLNYVYNNQIGGIKIVGNLGPCGIHGIRLDGGTFAANRCYNNAVGGNVTNSINNTSNFSLSQSVGIYNNRIYTDIHDNIIKNITSNGGTASGTLSAVIGICTDGVQITDLKHFIYDNQIYNLYNSNSTNAHHIVGIYAINTTDTANFITRNFIHTLKSNSNSVNTKIIGISNDEGYSLIGNNMISLGVDENGNSLTNSVSYYGIYDTLGSENYYFNSIYIGGSNVAGNANSYAFYGAANSSSRFYYNNIFCNARNNTNGSGKNFAIGMGGIVPNPAGLNTNYNVYYAPGLSGSIGFFNGQSYKDIADWKLAYGKDLNSFQGNPQFINPEGSSLTVNLHIRNDVPTIIEGRGLAGVFTLDYDKETRSALTPTDIGADAGNFIFTTRTTLILYSDSRSKDSISVHLTNLGLIDNCDILNTLPPTTMRNWKTVILLLGNGSNWSATARDSMKSFLDAANNVSTKKSLLVFGNDLGYLNDPRRNLSALPADTVFYRQYLKAQYWSDDWIDNFPTADSTTKGIVFPFTTISGQRINDQYPDCVAPATWNTGTGTLSAALIPVTESGNGDSCAAITYSGQYYNTFYGTNVYYGYVPTVSGALSPQGVVLNIIKTYIENNGGALPVELNSFTSNVDGSKIKLNWSTLFEQNNAGFEIQRKSTINSEFTKCGYISGSGTTNTVKNYIFTDNLSTGKYFYRLKQIDFNGNYKFYDLQNEVIVGIPSKFVLKQNYPNPFNPSTKINYELPVNGFVTLKIYDITGREVRQLVNEVQQAGYYFVNFNAAELASGVYIYKLNTDKFSDLKKMVVVK